MGKKRFMLILMGLVLSLLGVSASSLGQERGGATMLIEVTSAAFSDGGNIPERYTCDGEDLSPPLDWKGVPKGTKSLALICDDPDAPMGIWVHWVIFNIQGDSGGLPEGIASQETLADGTRQGRNDFRSIGYGGPCPPGGTHRYHFKLYALDAELELPAGATKAQLLEDMNGHVLAEGRLMGRYKR